MCTDPAVTITDELLQETVWIRMTGPVPGKMSPVQPKPRPRREM
jgi:hypothetical protein